MRKATKSRNEAAFGDHYVEILASEGYRPQREEDTDSVDLVFKSEGVQYRVVLYKDDPEFYGLSVCYAADPALSLEELLAFANAVNERWKVVKATIHPAGEAVRFQYEAFGELTAPVLERALGILRVASNAFFEDVRKTSTPKAQA